MHKRVNALLTVVLVAAAGVVPAAGQTIDDAMGLYAGASYSEALGVLAKIEATPSDPSALREVLRFRALCLLALDRPTDAEQAVDRLVALDPLYLPDAVETPPQLRKLFQTVRERRLPLLVRERYTRAKQMFERGDSGQSADAFDDVLLLLAVPEAVSGLGAEAATDLRTLAESFRDLAKERTRQRDLAKQDDRDAVKPSSFSDRDGIGTSGTQRAPAVFSAEDADVTAPRLIRQDFPSADQRLIRLAAQGVLEIVIDENGAVETAVLRRMIHPAYDNMLLARAKSWRYTPAMRDGVPVKYRKLLEIRINPPQK